MDGFLHRLIAQIIAGSGFSVFHLVNFSEEANITLIGISVSSAIMGLFGATLGRQWLR